MQGKNFILKTIIILLLVLIMGYLIYKQPNVEKIAYYYNNSDSCNSILLADDKVEDEFNNTLDIKSKIKEKGK